MNDEKLHLIISNYYLSDEKANHSVKEADEMASKLIESRDQQIALEARIDELRHIDGVDDMPICFQGITYKTVKGRLATLTQSLNKENK